ncbi:MAG TPA: peptide deformylase [Gemmatimonadales bacterium]|nr:peptide deformylase [Gemmatimonadales bacterium]
MPLRPLHLLGSPVLRERSAEVAGLDDEVRALIDDMFETMDAAQGVGLAANQVGVARRVAVIDAEGQRFAMVNPVLVEVSGRATGEEGCLSIPDIYGEVTRPERVVLEALGRDGEPFRLEAQGLTARAIQHEIDHLDGILFLDHLGPIRRKMLLARWKKDHRGDPSYIKPVKPRPARADAPAD